MVNKQKSKSKLKSNQSSMGLRKTALVLLNTTKTQRWFSYKLVLYETRICFPWTHYIETKYNQNNEYEISQENDISLLGQLDLKKVTTEAEFPIINKIISQ